MGVSEVSDKNETNASYPVDDMTEEDIPADDGQTDDVSVEYKGKEYDFDIVENNDGDYSLRYKVRWGDNLITILAAAKLAAKKLNARLADDQDTPAGVKRANPRIRNVNLIKPGWRIKVRLDGYGEEDGGESRTRTWEVEGTNEPPKVVPPPQLNNDALERQRIFSDEMPIGGPTTPTSVEDGATILAQGARPTVEVPSMPAESPAAPENAAKVEAPDDKGIEKTGKEFIRAVNPKLKEADVNLIWDIVKRECNEHGLDPFVILALIARESRFKPRAMSTFYDKKGNPHHCYGIMQFLPSTAARFGLSVNDTYDVRKAIPAGIHYLVFNCKIKERGLMGIACYNAGEGRPRKAYFRQFGDVAGEAAIRCPWGNGYDQTKLYLYFIYNTAEALRRGDVKRAEYCIDHFERSDAERFIRGVRAGDYNGWDPSR